MRNHQNKRSASPCNHPKHFDSTLNILQHLHQLPQTSKLAKVTSLKKKHISIEDQSLPFKISTRFPITFQMAPKLTGRVKA